MGYGCYHYDKNIPGFLSPINLKENNWMNERITNKLNF